MDVKTLESMELFEGLSADEVGRCAEAFEEVEVLAGSALTREGDFSYRFFVVIEGEVEVLREFDSIAKLGPGECFGEMGVATDAPRNARVVAVERSLVARMIGWDFRQMMDEIPALGARIQHIIDLRSASGSSSDN